MAWLKSCKKKTLEVFLHVYLDFTSTSLRNLRKYLKSLSKILFGKLSLVEELEEIHRIINVVSDAVKHRTERAQPVTVSPPHVQPPAQPDTVPPPRVQSPPGELPPAESLSSSDDSTGNKNI